jgi:hypothetical protein
MALHLSMSGYGLNNVQGSEGGFSEARVDFFGLHIVDNYGQESGSFVSPSIILAIMVIFNLVLLFKNRYSNYILLNVVFLIGTLISYHIFLHNLNLNLELATGSSSYWFRGMNLFGYEFFEEPGRNTIKGYNYSLYFLIVELLFSITAFFSSDCENKTEGKNIVKTLKTILN